jgi:heme-degrading monooxygenase HmoA
MKSDLRRAVVGAAILLCASGAACGGSGGSGGGGGGSDNDPFAGCDKGTIESDQAIDAPLSGPGVDPKTGELVAGHYLIATTYLALVPAEAQHAQSLGGDVVRTLPSMKGLVAFGLSSSASCSTLRTLTVWDSEEDMTAFVTSPAHAKAMGQIQTLSRGSSDVTAWSGDASDATWTGAAAALAKTRASGL